MKTSFNNGARYQNEIQMLTWKTRLLHLTLEVPDLLCTPFTRTNQEFAASLFNLFDVDEHGAIKQEELFELLRINVRSGQSHICHRECNNVPSYVPPSNLVFRHDHFSHANLEFRADVVDLLESVCYVICQDEDISIDSFHRIVSSRSVPEKLFRLANPRATSTASSASSSSLEMTVDDLLNFLIILSTPK